MDRQIDRYIDKWQPLGVNVVYLIYSWVWIIFKSNKISFRKMRASTEEDKGRDFKQTQY